MERENLPKLNSSNISVREKSRILLTFTSTEYLQIQETLIFSKKAEGTNYFLKQPDEALTQNSNLFWLKKNLAICFTPKLKMRVTKSKESQSVFQKDVHKFLSTVSQIFFIFYGKSKICHTHLPSKPVSLLPKALILALYLLQF